MAWRRFAAAGLVPGSLVGWELFAYGKQRQKFDDAKKVRPKPLVQGSTAWLNERDAPGRQLRAAPSRGRAR